MESKDSFFLKSPCPVQVCKVKQVAVVKERNFTSPIQVTHLAKTLVSLLVILERASGILLVSCMICFPPGDWSPFFLNYRHQLKLS